MAITKPAVVFGHVPRKISSICSLYLRHGGTIYCTDIGIRRYSEDLVRSGLEIPCVLRFEGSELYASKAALLLLVIST